jgi:2-iminobutanoate/2-iminopropanoate deaminase
MVEFLVPAEDAGFSARFGLSRASSSGRFLFSAAMALDGEKMQRLAEADSIAAETRICLDRLKDVLDAQGRALSDIVKLTVYLSDIAFQKEAEKAIADYFGADKQPLYLTIGAGLACGCRVEIEMIALSA